MAEKKEHYLHPTLTNAVDTKCTDPVEKEKLVCRLEKVILSINIEPKVRNVLFPSVGEESIARMCTDPLQFIHDAGAQWEEDVRKEIYTFCEEIKIRREGQQRVWTQCDELKRIWNNLSSFEIDLSRCRPLRTSEQLRDVLLALTAPPKQDSSDVMEWEFSDIEMKVKNMSELRTFFADLVSRYPYEPPLDVDKECASVLDSQRPYLARKFLKRLVTPMASRGHLWSQALADNPSPNNFGFNYFKKLCGQVQAHEDAMDKIIFKDVRDTIQNDGKYISYADMLYQIMLCFTRDKEIAKQIEFHGYWMKAKLYNGPPSGILPFQGISMFAAPFCLIYLSPVNLYFTFREFYLRYCHPLTTLNAHPKGLVALCLLFEVLLQTHATPLYAHFREHNIKPVGLVFKWLMFAFNGALPSEELRILWDIIVAFDSTEILPVLAFSILRYRKKRLMKKTTLSQVEEALDDLSNIKVVPQVKYTLTKL